VDGVDGDGSPAEGVAPEREESLDELIVGEDDDEDRTQPHEVRIKKLSAKNRKLQRRLMREADKAKRYDGLDDPDTVRVRLREAAQLKDLIHNNPELRALLQQGGKPKEEPTRRPDAEPEFDEAALPFDPNENPANRYFADLAKTNHALVRKVAALEGRINQVDGRDVARTEASAWQEWNAATDAALAQVADDGVRLLLKDQMTAAWTLHGKTKQYTHQHILNHYLTGPLKKFLKPAEAARATAAAAASATTRTTAEQQRIAERNRGLPRTVAPSGTPAPARSGGERLADVARRIRHQVARAG
jgi:hypothetical protein